MQYWDKKIDDTHSSHNPNLKFSLISAPVLAKGKIFPVKIIYPEAVFDMSASCLTKLLRKKVDG